MLRVSFIDSALRSITVTHCFYYLNRQTLLIVWMGDRRQVSKSTDGWLKYRWLTVPVSKLDAEKISVVLNR